LFFIEAIIEIDTISAEINMIVFVFIARPELTAFIEFVNPFAFIIFPEPSHPQSFITIGAASTLGASGIT
jgi:hypothetical protein